MSNLSQNVIVALLTGLAAISALFAAKAEEGADVQQELQGVAAREDGQIRRIEETQLHSQSGSTTSTLFVISSEQRRDLLALLNASTTAELVLIPHIGSQRAAALINARPFESLKQLREVPGIGASIVAAIVAYAAGSTT